MQGSKTQVSKALKKLMIDKEVTQVEVAARLEKEKQNLNNKLRNNNFRISEIEEIADILGYDIKLQFTDRYTGKVVDA